MEFLEKPVLRLLGGGFQNHCPHNLFRMQLSLPFTPASGTKYFCKSLLVDTCQGLGKLMTFSVVFSLNDTEISSGI